MNKRYANNNYLLDLKYLKNNLLLNHKGIKLLNYNI